jgi:hypothetical protein
MGMHAQETELDFTEATRLLKEALECFKSDVPIVATSYVNLAQLECERTGKSAEDFGRLLLELAYEMGACGLDDKPIEDLLRRASVVMINSMAGDIEVLVTAARIRLLQSDPVGALRLCSRVTTMLDMGHPIEATLLERFRVCEYQARKAIAAIEIAKLDASYYTE